MSTHSEPRRWTLHGTALRRTAALAKDGPIVASCPPVSVREDKATSADREKAAEGLLAIWPMQLRPSRPGRDEVGDGVSVPLSWQELSEEVKIEFRLKADKQLSLAHIFREMDGS